MEVLVAEDESVTRHKLIKYLIDWGFETVQADNGTDAMKILSDWKETGIAILDWEMPGMNGIEICRKARMDPKLKNTYFIMLTSRDEQSDMIEGFEAGADDYLSKPFDKEELRARMIAGKRIINLETELENRALDAEQKYLDLFQTSVGGIIQLDISENDDGISKIPIKAANPIICSLLGYDKEEISGLPLNNTVHPGDIAKMDRIWNDMNMLSPENRIYEIRFLRKDRGVIWTCTSYTELSGNQDGQKCIALHINDITEKKKKHLDRMKKMLNYELDEGNVYLVLESVPDSSIEAFRELMSVGYHGTVFSRRPPDEFKKFVKGDYYQYWLSEKETDRSISADTWAIRELFDPLPNKEIVYMDRIEYLISRASFKDVLFMIQSLKDNMIIKESISILTVDPATLSTREKAYLVNECSEMQPTFKANISKDLFDILRTIQRSAFNHIDASMNLIEEELGISRPTTRKRINKLVDFGYLNEAHKGKVKIYDLTDKGKKIVKE